MHMRVACIIVLKGHLCFSWPRLKTSQGYCFPCLPHSSLDCLLLLGVRLYWGISYIIHPFVGCLLFSVEQSLTSGFSYISVFCFCFIISLWDFLLILTWLSMNLKYVYFYIVSIMFRYFFYGISSPGDMDTLLPETEPSKYLSDIKMLSSDRVWKNPSPPRPHTGWNELN